MKAKVQTNDESINILVETTSSSNRHYSHLDKMVDVIRVLSDSEIIELWEQRKIDDNKLSLAKVWIQKQEGYAVSNCVDNSMLISYSSVVKYEELK